MDPNSGRVYTPDEYERLTKEQKAELVEIVGTEEQVASISAAVRAQHRRRTKIDRKRTKTAKASRRANRRQS